MGELSNLQLRGIRGGVWATGNAIASAGLAFLNFVVLSRILGPESFGLMAMVDASLALGQTLLATSLAESPDQRSGDADLRPGAERPRASEAGLLRRLPPDG